MHTTRHFRTHTFTFTNTHTTPHTTMSIQTHAPKHPHPHPHAPALPHAGGTIAFPACSPADEEHAAEYWDGRGEKPKHRTVRRKKSSFDLRHVFKTGGVIPNAPQSSVSVL